MFEKFDKVILFIFILPAKLYKHTEHQHQMQPTPEPSVEEKDFQKQY